MKSKYPIIILLAVVVIFSGCTENQPQVTSTVTSTAQPTSTIQSTSTVEETSTLEPTSTLQILPELRQFTIVSEKYSMTPDTITVRKGDMVKLHLTSNEVSFFFAIKGYKISTKVYPQRFETVTFVANKTGNYTMYYTRRAGSPQWSMQGLLIVED